MEKYVFKCKECPYSTTNKQSFDRHVIAGKHNDEKKYICECGKKYKHRQSLYNHKRKCEYSFAYGEENNNENIKITPQMFYNLIEQNNELHRKIMEIVPTENNTFIIRIRKEFYENSINSHIFQYRGSTVRYII